MAVTGSTKKTHNASHCGHVETSFPNHCKGGKIGQRPSTSAHIPSLRWERQTEKKNSCAGQSPQTFLPYPRRAPITKPYPTVAGSRAPCGFFSPTALLRQTQLQEAQTCLLARPGGQTLGTPPPRKQEGVLDRES